MNGGLPTNASNPPRSRKTSGNSSGPVERLGAPDLLASRAALGLQGVGGDVPDPVVDLLQGGPEQVDAVGGAGGLPACGEQAVGGVGEAAGLELDVVEEVPLFLDGAGGVVGDLLQADGGVAWSSSMILGIMSSMFGRVMPTPWRSSEKVCNCSSSTPTSESPHRMAWSRKVKGLSFARVSSQSESLAISTASGFLSTPYRQRWATIRRA